MLRTSRIPAIVLALFLAIFTLAGCGDDGGGDGDTPTDSSATSDSPSAKASKVAKSCQAIVGSGAVEDIQAVFDKYKDNTNPFTAADAKKMRDALDRLAKAGDNAEQNVREDVVHLVADMGTLIDSRAQLPGVGKVASVETVQKEIDALCR